MADLVAFLRARLDEDEAAARLSWPGPWSYNPAKRWLEPDQLAREQAGLPVFGGEEFVARRMPGKPVECIALTGVADDPDAMGTAAHIARWDPARVLAEVAAKRAVLDLHPAVSQPSGLWCATCGDWPQPGDEQGVASWPCPTLLALAQIYADRPDFDPAWRTDRG